MPTVAEIVTDRIIKKIEEAGSWLKPWQCINPLNWATLQEYTGINRWLLSGREYMTLRQAREKGYSLGPTAKGNSEIIVRVVFKETPVGSSRQDLGNFFIKVLKLEGFTPEEALEEAIKQGLLVDKKGVLHKRTVKYRYYTVFEISHFVDKDGNPPISRFTTGEVEDVIIGRPEEIIQSYLNRSGVKLVCEDINKAYYSVSRDILNMPPKEQFLEKTDAIHYYSTFFHEIAHSTGHPSRLNRPLSGVKGSEPYAFEELIAELSASMLCHETGLAEYNREMYEELEENSAAYIKAWVQYLKDHPKAIIQAASKAEKVKDFVLNWANENIIPVETDIDVEE